MRYRWLIPDDTFWSYRDRWDLALECIRIWRWGWPVNAPHPAPPDIIKAWQTIGALR